MKPKILVTAASGKTGSATAMQLLEKGYPVRALVRSADSRSERLRQHGAEIVTGDLSDIVEVRRHWQASNGPISVRLGHWGRLPAV